MTHGANLAAPELLVCQMPVSVALCAENKTVFDEAKVVVR
jgi:hypothetical protein